MTALTKPPSRDKPVFLPEVLYQGTASGSVSSGRHQCLRTRFPLHHPVDPSGIVSLVHQDGSPPHIRLLKMRDDVRDPLMIPRMVSEPSAAYIRGDNHGQRGRHQHDRLVDHVVVLEPYVLGSDHLIDGTFEPVAADILGCLR